MALIHPVITFEVNLDVPKTEAFGPLTSETEVRILHPDRHQNDQDKAVTDIDNHKNNKSTWIPGLTVGENRALKHEDQFTADGLRATYLKDNYTTGLNPILKVV